MSCYRRRYAQGCAALCDTPRPATSYSQRVTCGFLPYICGYWRACVLCAAYSAYWVGVGERGRTTAAAAVYSPADAARINRLYDTSSYICTESARGCGIGAACAAARGNALQEHDAPGMHTRTPTLCTPYCRRPTAVGTRWCASTGG